MKPLFWLLFLVLGIQTPAHAGPQNGSPPPLNVDRIENDVVFFKKSPSSEGSASPASPRPSGVFSIKTGLIDLKSLGFLSRKSTPVYWIASGKKCVDCPFEKGIYLFALPDPSLPQQPSPPPSPSGLVYPGKVIDARSGELLLSSRAFFGTCLPGKPDVYLSFQKEKVDRRARLQSSVMVVEVSEQGLHEKLLERNFPRLDTVLRAVKQKKCTEIIGRNRHSIPRGATLFPGKARLPDEEDHEEEDPKETQTSSELKVTETE